MSRLTLQVEEKDFRLVEDSENRSKTTWRGRGRKREKIKGMEREKGRETWRQTHTILILKHL